MKCYLLALMFTACGPRIPPHDHVVSIALPFQKYFVAFENDAITNNHFQQIDDLIIQFQSDMTSAWAGYCANQGGVYATPTISVNTLYWTNLSNDQQQALIYHEMGHCVLNREHKTTMWNTVPDSIMYPSVLRAGLLTQYHDHYVTELFTGMP